MKLAGGITEQDLKLFLAEADEQLQLLDEDIVKLEREAGNTALIQEIFRAAHTIKGSSAMLGHQRMSEVAHAMENIFDAVRKRSLAVIPTTVDALLAGLDALKALKKELTSGGAPEADIGPAKAQLAAALVASAADRPSSAGATAAQFALDDAGRARLDKALSEGKRGLGIRVQLSRGTSWAAVRCFQVLQEMSSISEVISSSPSKEDIEAEKASEVLQLLVATDKEEMTVRDRIAAVSDVEKVDITPILMDQPPGAARAPAAEAQPKKEEAVLGHTIRVDIGRLDALMEQIGELVISRNRIGQIGKILGEKYREDELIGTLGESLSQIGKVVNALQQDIMAIRMLPIDLVFNTMPRMVRDLARQTGKSIDFIVEGQDTEVDRSVIEHIRDPLVHLLRNAIDHGVEPAEDRKKAGKPETATVRLSAYHQQDYIVINVVDDGRGIDPEAVKKSAVKKGFITAEAAEALTEEEASNLIFASGVSTAARVTQISGRGVGLDIVRKNIEPLNGAVTVHSEKGKGTRFTLTLPLTLAIIPVLLVTVERTTFAIPLSSIVEAIKLPAAQIQRVKGKEATVFRGSVLPLLRLNSAFGWDTDAAGVPDPEQVVVVKAGETRIGLIVDALVEQQEIVVKSFDEFIDGVNGITGASILGDGQVVLILDVASLVRQSGAETRGEKRSARKGSAN